jgi:hypothetical protein
MTDDILLINRACFILLVIVGLRSTVVFITSVVRVDRPLICIRRLSYDVIRIVWLSFEGQFIISRSSRTYRVVLQVQRHL